jgi:hypothetical protein
MGYEKEGSMSTRSSKGTLDILHCKKAQWIDVSCIGDGMLGKSSYRCTTLGCGELCSGEKTEDRPPAYDPSGTIARDLSKRRSNMKVHHKWTDEEVTYLRENRGQASVEEMADHLGLKIGQIQGRINKIRAEGGDYPVKKVTVEMKEKGISLDYFERKGFEISAVTITMRKVNRPSLKSIVGTDI